MSSLVPAAILAGGRSNRMGGGDKCLLSLGDSSILANVVASVQPQAGAILLNSNSDPKLFSGFQLPVRADALPGRLGPLAGVHTAMLWAQEMGAADVMTVPGDMAFLPEDLLAQLVTASAGQQIAIAACAGDLHPIIGLWPSRLAAQLGQELENGLRRVRTWLDQMSFRIAQFDSDRWAGFSNINTPADLEWARRTWAASPRLVHAFGDEVGKSANAASGLGLFL